MTKEKPKRKFYPVQHRKTEREKSVLRPFFRAVFPDHGAQPPLLLRPFFYIKEEKKKPLSSRRVKRLFSNLLADIGFITSLSFVSTPFPRHSNVGFLRFSLIFIVGVPLLPPVEKPWPLLGRVMACKRLSTRAHTQNSIVFFRRLGTRNCWNMEPRPLQPLTGRNRPSGLFIRGPAVRF